MAKKRLIDAGGIVAVAEKAYDAWNLAMATADGNEYVNVKQSNDTTGNM